MTAQFNEPGDPKRPVPDGGAPDLERMARDLPRRDAPDSLWPRIEQSLREEQRRAAERPESFVDRLARAFRVPAVTLALYGVILLVGAGMSWYLLREYAQRDEATAIATQSSDEMMHDAQSDIEQAMFYYERAIGKLTVLAERNEGKLDPQFVALQKDKISLLRSSIDECKAALAKNGTHPEVQHYLLLAYNDLQSTLQQMVNRAN
ncbi:MAG: hypothetical protein IH600_11965 [Bacteroidetes bacterium]|nr:hypothetical protein [Bacteroidota bacterium]